MTTSSPGRAVLLVIVVCAGALAACGKKGPPLPPLARIPTAPGNPQAVRVGDEVYVSFGVPATNVSGQTPADVSAVDLYAFTGSAPPPGPDPTRYAVKVGTYPVYPPMPPPPPPPEGAPVPPPMPTPPGFEQGTTAVVRETLTPDALQPTPMGGDATGLPRAPDAAATETAAADPTQPVLSGPLVPPSEATALKRFYFLVAQGPRNRTSAPTATVAVPVQGASTPPTDVRLAYTAAGITLAWTPSADARVAPPAPTDASLLTSKPLTPPPAATTYLVFEAPPTARPPADEYRVQLPVPITPQPTAVPQAAVPGPLAFGVERCFVVRAVDTIAGVVTLGHASEPGCITPTDTFPPAPPQRLAAIAGVGVINLIWEPNTEPDLAGYIVLRGAAPGDTLQALTPAPIRETTYRDTSVRPGEQYVYAVVAVDNATPQNVSGQSNRVEESSRAPR